MDKTAITPCGEGDVLVRASRRRAIILLKYCPVITAAVMMIHVIAMIFGYTFGIAETLCGLSLLPQVVAYELSKGLGFCKMHRMFIDYTFKMYLCMQWHQWVGFGPYLIYFQWLMVALGIYTFGYFFWHIKEYI